MKKINLTLLIGLTAFLYLGCSHDVADPAGGLVGVAEHPFWEITAPVVIINENLYVENLGDTINWNGMATTRSYFEFKDYVTLVTFTWLTDKTADSLVACSVLNASGKETELLVSKISEGAYKAQFQYVDPYKEPVRFRFRFLMKPQSQILVCDLRYTTNL